MALLSVIKTDTGERSKFLYIRINYLSEVISVRFLVLVF